MPNTTSIQCVIRAHWIPLTPKLHHYHANDNIPVKIAFRLSNPEFLSDGVLSTGPLVDVFRQHKPLKLFN